MNSEETIYNFKLNAIDGDGVALDRFKGKALLLVNVASECGFTPQYADLEALYRKYREQGLFVLGIPSNDFGAQEPGSNQQIAEFCKSEYDVTFPLFEKISVKGENQHPLYRWLTAAAGQVSWNFNKFLIGRDGKIRRRYETKVKPFDQKLVQDIEQEVATGA